MLTLDHFKLLSNFKSQFPIEEFLDKRKDIILSLPENTHPLDVAVRALVAQPGTSPKKAAATVYDNMSRLIAAPLRGASRTARWFVDGSRAWVTLRPGSRPRRVARRLKMMLLTTLSSRSR